MKHVWPFFLASFAFCQSTPSGDPQAGKVLYGKSACRACHAIQGEGGTFGPDLSKIGSMRTPEAILESIVNPSADIPKEWEGVVAIQKNGRKIQGIRVSEDAASIEIRDMSGKVHALDKLADIKYLQSMDKSAMPPYARFTPKERDDIVAYLYTLQSH